MTSLRLLIIALATGLVLAGGASSAGSSGGAATARAIAVRIVVPGDTAATGGAVSSPPAASSSGGGFTWRDAVSTGAFSSSSRAIGGDRGNGSARAQIGDVSLFGGEITVGEIDTRAAATASGEGAHGTVAASSVGSLVVLGHAVSAAPNRRVALADWGYAVVLEQAVVRSSERRYGFRGFVTGLHVRLTKEHAGLPAGTDVMLGYAEAAASAPKPEPKPTPKPKPKPTQGGSGSGSSKEPPKDPVPAPSGSAPAPPPIVHNPPAGVRPHLTDSGYVFPVYGPSSFSDDFGAPRADVGWHHGNDIYAPTGTPVLAVADGTLFLVGWNDLGGNRLWLRDKRGNEFYYAHLSAYTPLAVEGSRVHAGDVVGFVGNTGDAATTPPHLHFEVHPASLLGLGYDGVIDPYPYLLAWKRLSDVSFGAASWPAGPAPPPGAVLLEAEDISSVSGLDLAGLTRVLVMRSLFAEGRTFLAAPSQPAVTNAPVGFSP